MLSGLSALLTELSISTIYILNGALASRRTGFGSGCVLRDGPREMMEQDQDVRSEQLWSDETGRVQETHLEIQQRV